MKKIIVAIDGYSSCGKSTMAKALAQQNGYVYVDTGAMYRAVSLYCIEHKLMSPTLIDKKELEQHISDIKIWFKNMPDGLQHTYLNGKDVESKIRTLEVADGASRVSTIGFVRRFLVHQQQQMGIAKGIVMDGRDIGTVVFPNAELKVFVTASPEVRAQRRFKELISKGENADFNEVLANVKERDERDTNRIESPLHQAEDAYLLDNSNLTPPQQLQIIQKWFDEKVK